MALSLRFGKHKGRTVEWLFFNDPGYVYWMVEQGIDKDTKWFNVHQQSEFEALIRKASHIRIPGICSWCRQEPVTRMFLTVHTSGGLACVDFDCDNCAPEGRGSVALPPGFWTPDFFRNYDKTGAKFLVDAIKSRMFGSRSHRMTEKRITEFWSNNDNFVNE
jgi:hypothetical protein